MAKLTAFSHQPPSPSLLASVTRLSGRLGEPASYAAGVETGKVILPRSILLFSRRDTEDLTPSIKQHHRFVFIVALDGAGTVCIEDRTFALDTGKAILILPFQSHCYFEVTSKIHWLFITFEHSADPRLEALRFREALCLKTVGFDCVQDLLASWHNRKKRTFLPLALSRLIHLLMESPAYPKRRGISSRHPASGSALVARINHLANLHRGKPLSLRELGEKLGISSSHLGSEFRRLTNRSLGRHLRELRLQYACNLLHNTGLRIGEVAARCGYESLFTFSRAFRNVNHCSPRTYRSRHAGG